ncbi:MAG TPA: hypothetical protein VGA73_04010 [Candidatus Binatia bacterium]
MLKLQVFLKVDRPKPLRRKLGEVVLSHLGTGASFKAIRRQVFDPKYAGILVTAWGEAGEEKFLREGYGFWLKRGRGRVDREAGY